MFSRIHDVLLMIFVLRVAYCGITRRFIFHLEPKTWNAAYYSCRALQHRLLDLQEPTYEHILSTLFTTGAYQAIQPQEFWIGLYADHAVDKDHYVWDSTCRPTSLPPIGHAQNGPPPPDQYCVYARIEHGKIVLYKADCAVLTKPYICEEACTDVLQNSEGTMYSPKGVVDSTIFDCVEICQAGVHNNVSCGGFTYNTESMECRFHYPGDIKALYTSKVTSSDSEIRILAYCDPLHITDIYIGTCNSHAAGRCVTTSGTCPYLDYTFSNHGSQGNEGTTTTTRTVTDDVNVNVTSSVISTAEAGTNTTPRNNSNSNSAHWDEERARKFRKRLETFLVVNPKSTKKSLRRLISVDDKRPISRYVGYVGVTILVTIATVIVLSDVITFFIHVQMKEEK